MTTSKRTAPRHRRPALELDDPTSEYFTPNAPEVRAQLLSPAPAPRHEVRRKTRLETAEEEAATREESNWRRRLDRAQEEGERPPEPTECPRCGLTEIQALKTQQPPAVIVAPGKVLCSCSAEVIDVKALLAKQRGEQSAEQRMILECWREQRNIAHEPGGGGNGGGGKTETPNKVIRVEQELPGLPQRDKVRTEHQEGLDRPLEGMVPRALKKRLRQAAKDADTSMNRVFRYLLHLHLQNLDEVHEVEYAGDNEFLRVQVTKEWKALWTGKKDDLRQQHPKISDADMMASLMLEEWA